MENDVIPTESDIRKRKNEENKVQTIPKTKKARLYSVKDFRKQLNSGEKLAALKEFLNAIKGSNKHDYVFDYLENGGNCLELLQTLESDSTIPPLIVFELVTHLLLRINANYSEYFSSAFESCRYLINNYLPVVHKMLGLSSSKDERKACLKLLTSMAAFSPSLAKDILINVKFHSANIELLTKHTGEIDSVRDAFIHFLTAFLVDVDLHTLSILLEKSVLLTSIISGLQYDVADTVCIVVAAMKNHILENTSVMKTTKMHTFNTSIVKDIVNLYNWKGPEGLKALEKNNKIIFEVDKIAKSKVSECVHDFLLVLCTSHKFGVIFRDPLVGLGRKNQNGLMYTVLDSLDRPWEHSYASELVIKICKACPDLSKNMWAILKPFLEPRLTEKWLNAMNFARKLLKELEPSCINYCAKDLSPQQLAQIIQILVSPSPILKILLPENSVYENPSIKQHISIVLFDMLESVDTYLNSNKYCTSIDNYKKVKNYLSNHISKNFPSAQILLKDWKTLFDNENTESNVEDKSLEYLETVLDIFNLYKNLAPQLLCDLASGSINLKDFLLKLSSKLQSEAKLDTLQMKIVNIFVDLDHSYFLPKTENFAYVVPMLLKLYHKTKSKEIQNVLIKVLINTAIFEGCFYEINIFLNGIFNFNTLTDEFARNFVQLVKNTSENILLYQQELSQISIDQEPQENYENIIETLLNINESTDNSKQIKHRHLSPLLIGFIKFLQENGGSKSLKKYSELVLLNLFHAQTSLQKFAMVILTYHDVIPSNIFQYVQNWAQGQRGPLKKYKGAMNVFKTYSEAFLNGTLIEDMLKDVFYPDFYVDILLTSIFYFSNLVCSGLVLDSQSKNLIFLVHFLDQQNVLDETCFEIILGDPNLIKNFNITEFNNSNSLGICAQTIFEIVKYLKDSNKDIDRYLKVYSGKIVSTIIKIIKKPKKFGFIKNITEFLHIFSLTYNHCIQVLTRIFEGPNTNLDISEQPVLFEIVCYTLNRVASLCEEHFDFKPLSKVVVSGISSLIVNLNNKNNDSGSLSTALKSYLRVFPHNIADLDKHVFSSILKLTEYNKENIDLAVFLLERNVLELCKEVEASIDFIADKKGVILPLTHVLVNCSCEENILRSIYDALESSIMKALQKPQKVGQHFLKNYDIPTLLQKCMSIENCKRFTEKVQKFEVTEVFHVRLLEVCYSKVIETTDLSDKMINNIILTFVHLQMTNFKRKSKSDEDINTKINDISNIFNSVLEKLLSKAKNDSINLKNTAANETFKTFSKFSLKFGISGMHVLLKTLTNLVKILSDSLEKDDASLLLEMLLSHSEFLNTVLGEHNDTKLEVLTFILVMCQNWSNLMERSHVAVILSAYRGMVTKCDRTILALLKLYESKSEQTRFYDFKPFLWGRAAATHYSVRSQIESALTRQPKTSDILGILKEDLVKFTITNYPIQDNLRHQNTENIVDIKDSRCYDLQFMLPLFSHILAPEQQVRTYVFTRSGALSLTVIGLSSEDEEVRKAACHVLSRFHFHLEARQTGKDNLLWVRFVEALCKGAAVLPNFKLNHFAAIFFARMSLILTNPKHLMFFPLSSYLTAKQDLDISTVPELYTLLYSSEVNFKEHRSFILEILRDGLRTDKDFVDFLKSMGFKLFSELYSCCLSDLECKLLILDVVNSACKISLGVNVLCENYSLLSQLYTLVNGVLVEIKFATTVLSKILNIFHEIIKTKKDKYTNKMVLDIIIDIFKSNVFLSLRDSDIGYFYEVLYTVYANSPDIFKSKDFYLDMLLEKSPDNFCKYIKEFGCKYINEQSLCTSEKDRFYFLRLLTFKLL